METAGEAQLAQPTGLEGLTEGRIVHYVMSDGQHRPAIVVLVWRRPEGQPEPSGSVQLQVFTDGGNDPWQGGQFMLGMFWATSVYYDATGTRRHTWHWPERV